MSEQKQNQFHAGSGLSTLNHQLSTSEYSGWPKPEPVVVMSESEARRLVAAIDNCWPSDALAIIQRQPWFREIRAGIRATRHLKPADYIKLSERTSQLPTS